MLRSGKQAFVLRRTTTFLENDCRGKAKTTIDDLPQDT